MRKIIKAILIIGFLLACLWGYSQADATESVCTNQGMSDWDGCDVIVITD